MKTTIKLFLVMFALFVSNVVFAQIPKVGNYTSRPNGPPPVPNTEQINEIVSNLSLELGLTSAQEDNVLELYLAHFSQVKGITSENKMPPREEMEKLKLDFEKEVKALLSEEQKVGFDKFRKKHQKPKPPKREKR